MNIVRLIVAATAATLLGANVRSAVAVGPVNPTSPAAQDQRVDAQIVRRAKEWFYRFRSGTIDRSQLSDQANSELTAEAISKESARLKQLGQPTSFTFLRKYIIAGAFGYDFLWQYSAARVVEMIAIDGQGVIVGIDFQIFVSTDPHETAKPSLSPA